ncbi:MAG: CHAT domain-containing protein [Symploca sp. SIO3E6]|nr:CHAT domain-containing protein [Caldora sp. SIO3E6]
MVRKQYLLFPGIPTLLAISWTGIGVLAAEVTTPNRSNQNSLDQFSTNSLVQEGRALYEAQKYHEAAKFLQQAAAEFKTTGDQLSLSMTLSNLSLVYQQLGQWQEAEQAITESLNQLQGISGSSTMQLKLLAQALEVKGKLKLGTGKLEEALKLWKEAAAKYAQLGDNIGEIRCQIHQSLALQELGLYRRALKILIQQPTNQLLQPTQRDSLVQARALRALGNVLRVVGDVEELEQSLLLFVPSDNKQKMDYLDQSRYLLEQSLEISERLRSLQDSSEAHLGLGNTARAAYYRTKDAFERARTLSNDLDNQLELIEDAISHYQKATTTTTLPIISIQAQLNQLSLLIDFQQRLPEIQDQSVENENLDALKSQFKELQERLPQLQTQINNLPSSRTTVYTRINLAQNLIQLSSPKEGTEELTNSNVIEQLLVKSVEQAQQLNDKRAEAYALGNLAGLYEKVYEKSSNTEALAQAQLLTQQALTLTEEIQASDIAYQWQWQLGRILKKRGEIDGAIAAYEAAVRTLKSVRQDLLSLKNPDVQFSFRDNVEPIYRELVDLLLQSASTLAYENSIKQTKANNKKEKHRLDKAREYIEDLQVAELEDYLRCRFKTNDSVIIDQVIDQNNLKTAVIYPILLEDRLEVILKLPEQAKLIQYSNPVSPSQIENTVWQLREAIKEDSNAQNNQSFQQLYDWLLRPAEKYLEENNIKTLVFVLDSSLRNIPMAALHDGEEYIMQKYSLALNLGSQLVDDKPLKPEEFRVLLAGVSESNLGFDELPYVKDEVELIEPLIPGIKVLLNEQFTPEALQKEIQSQPFSIIHLATHGQFSSNPDETFILAYKDRITINQLDKFLRSREEIQDNAIELLILSACQTAKGDKRAVLGIAGVSVQAGARSTIASVFNVNDHSTSVLMELLYQELAKNNVTKAEALRKAQEVMSQHQDYQNPKYWAPFILVGNWR